MGERATAPRSARPGAAFQRLPTDLADILARVDERVDGDALEAQTVREVLTVNGRRPSSHDPNNCATPEQ